MAWREQPGNGPGPAADDVPPPCVACDQTGAVHVLDPASGRWRWERCERCGGTGRVNDTTDRPSPLDGDSE